MRRHHGRGQNSPFANKTAAPVSEVVSLIRNFDSDINPSRPVRQSPLATSQIQGMPLDLIDRIRSFPLFQSTPDSFLAEVGLRLRPQLHSTNDYILTEGDDAKSMYWLVRGAVAVTSRDGESTYAELKPGAFFGEIGILMDRPRTATVIARTKCLLVVLKKEDLRKILPAYPEVEQAIRDEAQERLTILEKKKRQVQPDANPTAGSARRGSKRTRDFMSDENDVAHANGNGVNGISKKRKSPSPGPNEISSSSALGNGLVHVRSLLKELPLFTSLPSDLLHFLGLNALPRTFAPFTDIIRQDSKGREIFFIVKGEVEVLDEKVFETAASQKNSQRKGNRRPPYVKARLKEGHYFGEVVSLSLAPRRTATVRSVTAVECLMITAEVLAEFWERCPAGVRQQLEHTARERLRSASDNDVIMDDRDSAPAINQLAIGEQIMPLTPRKQPAPRVTFNDAELGSPHRYVKTEDEPVLRPSDPDPFLNVGLDKVRSRSRRGSLAPISPDDIEPDGRNKSTSPTNSRPDHPSAFDSGGSTPFSDPFGKLRSRAPTPRPSGPRARGSLPDRVLVNIFKHLRLHELFRLRAVSLHWSEILTKSPELFHYLDLTPYNRKLTDEVLSKHICPFVGERPRVINISNCFHITDEGFNILASLCGANVKTWKMKSVWDVTAPAILDMANKAKGLHEIDLSNCRKVSDTLLARILGWVVPATAPSRHTNGRLSLNTRITPQSTGQPAAGTVFGCPFLKRLTLSYCKHVTDRTMHHIASHASTRIEQMDLTRCTTITDTGFQYWGNAQFLRLKKLCLADCTYLTDNAIIYLTNAAKGLEELDLSFCCALSDTATEVLALGCPSLTHLNLSFCGSAGRKRASAEDGGPPEKRMKGEPEDTEVYSQRIKKKLQANSRTGQACDRCKERKMKCDSGQDGCQPCTSRSLRCMATDRITGHTHERGETARLKSDIDKLRAQINAYYRHFGPLPAEYSLPGPYQAYAPSHGYTSNPPPTQPIPLTEQHENLDIHRQNSANGPHRGPIHGTIIDFVDGEIDIGDFTCPDMTETEMISQATLPLNNSRRSSLTTILGAQKPEKPQMPGRDEAVQYIDNYLKVIATYVPIVHGPTFRKQVAEYYDHPGSFDDRPAEVVMIMVVLAIFAYQMATRNPQMRQEKLAESNRLYHYALSFYPELLLGDSLADMQALALFLVHARNLPKPGNSWSLSSMILARAIELGYHRSSNKIVLPPNQRNMLAIELRKRVFWSILGIQVTIAVKMGRPMAISPKDMDVELPQAILDSEITDQGFLPRSGNCDFWGHIFLSKKLPLLMDLYENVILVRKSAAEYHQDIGDLDAQITKWRHDWDVETASQTKNGSFKIATHLIGIWYAEFRIILHHPRLCTSQLAEVHEKNLDICLEASRSMLGDVMSLILDFKGPDFTWHFVSGYVLAMGMAMHVYGKRREHQTAETLSKMKRELQQWLFVIKSADYFMRSGDHLIEFLQPRAQQCLEDAQNVVTASEAIRNGYHHGAHSQPPQDESESQPPYSAAESYQQHPATYSESLSSNPRPPTTAPLPQQHTYNIQPPSISTSPAEQEAQQYDSNNNNNNNVYNMPIPQSSSPATTNTTIMATSTPAQDRNIPFLSDQATYPQQQQPQPYPGQTTTAYSTQTPTTASMYPQQPAISYPATANPDIFSADNIYSIPPGMWPIHIVQYQQGGI
ncbi:hypothetical protein GJ744_011152 [Endocarpon pusillum]|uniref:Zn(2)-C6 fungal-type domain-containing protein n=1 Tax=Endocarpon pusillum TaxID=364733 RepID=A0A8H7AGY1_9EURO|nr:hypothetical protein GJ744_011152 [Endocarpon pusillum]